MPETDQAAALVRSARRVLVVRTDDLGDNIISASFATSLAATITGEVGLVANDAAVGLIPIEGVGFVAGIDFRPRRPSDVPRAGRELASAIRSFRPEVVVTPRFDFEREALGVGLGLSLTRHLATWVTSTTPKRRLRSWWLGAFGGPRLEARAAPLHEQDRLAYFARWLGLAKEAAMPRLRETVLETALSESLDSPTSPLAVLHIGAAQPRRLWPANRFASVAELLAKKGYLAVLVGGKAERHLGEEVLSALGEGHGVENRVGEFSLAQVAALLGRASLFVGNDSGLGHLSAAVGTPTITISCHPIGAPPEHVNAPERYRPRIRPSAVCRPMQPRTPSCAHGCRSRRKPCCVLGVSTAEVASAIEAIERQLAPRPQ
jgi:ADP-heptose:LPS heptosyltransferase